MVIVSENSPNQPGSFFGGMDHHLLVFSTLTNLMIQRSRERAFVARQEELK
jgi:hypothetical protein